MVIGTALTWGNVETMALAIVLAFVFGYSFALFAGLSFKAAAKVALAADALSVAVMELVDNGVIAITPGAMDAHLSDGLFCSALVGGFAFALLIATPLSKWMIGRGRATPSSTPTTDSPAGGTSSGVMAPTQCVPCGE